MHEGFIVSGKVFVICFEDVYGLVTVQAVLAAQVSNIFFNKPIEERIVAELSNKSRKV